MKAWLQEANERRKAEAAVRYVTPEHIERTRMYWVWADMISRCTNPNHKHFKNYGGRGITVCQEWRCSFNEFSAAMGERPNGGLLDRVDNNEGYSPSNCRWATRKEQNSNRRNCRYVQLDGETLTLKEACRRIGITYKVGRKRIVERGWSFQQVVDEVSQ